MNPRIPLTMSIEDAQHVEDALSYFLAAARNNYGAGYQPGAEYDEIEREQYVAVERVMQRLGGLLERHPGVIRCVTQPLPERKPPCCTP